MNEKEFENLLRKLTKFGVVHRDEVKHFASHLQGLLKRKLLRKVYRRGKVFYEFTDQALPFLENYRQGLFSRVRNLNEGFPRRKVYSALLGDLRFLDESDPVAEEFRFLGDWQLKEPVVPSQLALAKAKYFGGLKNLEEK